MEQHSLMLFAVQTRKFQLFWEKELLLGGGGGWSSSLQNAEFLDWVAVKLFPIVSRQRCDDL